MGLGSGFCRSSSPLVGFLHCCWDYGRQNIHMEGRGWVQVLTSERERGDKGGRGTVKDKRLVTCFTGQAVSPNAIVLQVPQWVNPLIGPEPSRVGSTLED